MVHHQVFLDIGHPKQCDKWSHGKVARLNVVSMRHGALLYLGTMRPTMFMLILLHVWCKDRFSTSRCMRLTLELLLLFDYELPAGKGTIEFQPGFSKS